MGWGGERGSWGQTEFNLSYEKENEVEAESAMQHLRRINERSIQNTSAPIKMSSIGKLGQISSLPFAL